MDFSGGSQSPIVIDIETSADGFVNISGGIWEDWFTTLFSLMREAGHDISEELEDLSKSEFEKAWRAQDAAKTWNTWGNYYDDEPFGSWN
jgi:hypothetical protein